MKLSEHMMMPFWSTTLMLFLLLTPALDGHAVRPNGGRGAPLPMTTSPPPKDNPIIHKHMDRTAILPDGGRRSPLPMMTALPKDNTIINMAPDTHGDIVSFKSITAGRTCWWMTRPPQQTSTRTLTLSILVLRTRC
jgi:hypothetical protein